MTAPKLVRDLVPVSNTRIATADEMPGLLRAKLTEEVGEFLDSGDPRELADIVEVLRALADVAGIGPVGLERLRREKLEERGGFERRLVWLGDGESLAPTLVHPCCLHCSNSTGDCARCGKRDAVEHGLCGPCNVALEDEVLGRAP